MAGTWSSTEEADVVVAGGGIAGLATAVALKRIGVRKVVVLEKASQLRSTGACITLFPNAWRALAALGVAHKLLPLYPPFFKGCVTNLETGVSREIAFGTPDGKNEMGARAVHRSVLLETLAEELPSGTIRFSSAVSSISTEVHDGSTTNTILNLEDGSSISTKVLIGCDGVGSVVAQWLGLSAPVDSGRSAVRALAVYPQGHGLDHEVHQFVDGVKRAGYAPVNDKEVYWFVSHYSTPGEKSVARGDTKLLLEYVVKNMTKDLPPEFMDLIDHTDLSTLSWAPLRFRVPWNLIFKNPSKGTVTVAGDAMHPMTPDLGQGGCSSLEDAVVLGRNLVDCLNVDGSIGPTKVVVGGIDKYVKERKWRVAGLIAGAYVSGSLQQGGVGWLGWMVKIVRDNLFYRFFGRIFDFVNYDCGNLPTPGVQKLITERE